MIQMAGRRRVGEQAGLVKWGRFRGVGVLTLGLEWAEMLLGDPWVVKRKNRKWGAERPNVLLDDPRVVKWKFWMLQRKCIYVLRKIGGWKHGFWLSSRM